MVSLADWLMACGPAPGGGGGGPVDGITLVGFKTWQAKPSISNEPATIPLTDLTGGLGSAPAAGDFIVAFLYVADLSSSVPAVTSAGYSILSSQFAAATDWANFYSSLRLGYVVATKLVGAVADTSISVTMGVRSGSSFGILVCVYRGVDPVTPLDVALRQYARGTTSMSFDPLSVTPITVGAVIITSVGACYYNGLGAMSLAAPAEVSALNTINELSGSRELLAGFGQTAWDGLGPFDCSPWTETPTGPTSAEVSSVLVLRPA
jgi:hypothetical protein